jgi:hypothetical protein
MFLSVMLGYRTAFAALTGHRRLATFAVATLVCLSVGGMFLGPVVQKYAFGAYWTGWPNGKDLTDNKMLLLFVSWLFATAVALVLRRRRPFAARIALMAAVTVMVGVYLIPHSVRGSQLNYEKLEQGASETDAIETGARPLPVVPGHRRMKPGGETWRPTC